MGKTAEKQLTMAMEDYLEAIYEIGQEKKVARVRDIAARLDVKMPTVTSMLKNLKSHGLVAYEKYEYVELKPGGLEVARDIHWRHQLLRTFLNDILKIGHKTADEEACKMEHALSPATLDRFAAFMAFIHECPRAGESWLDHFDLFRRHGHQPDRCRTGANGFKCEFADKIEASCETEKRAF